MSEYLDLDGWKHREHYDFFRGFAMPFFSICADVDVTMMSQRSREPGGPSLFMATVFALLHAANAVEAMRLRVRGQRVLRHDRVSVSTTVLREDETFGLALLPYAEDLASFTADAEQKIAAVKNGRGLKDPVVDDDVVYHSTLPWLRFTAFSNALAGHDSIPRVVFGKWVANGDRIVMPVAVEVHHAVVHGLDVGRFYEQLQARLSAP